MGKDPKNFHRAESLKTGMRIRWGTHIGTIKSFTYRGVEVLWDNGSITLAPAHRLRPL